MVNVTSDPDVYLPVLPLISYSDIIEHHSPASIMKVGLWNKTNKESLTLYHHPILYAIGIYALLLVIIGTIGNGLTIIILLRPNLRRHTTMRYLIAVATADLCALYSWNLNLVYKHLINPYQNDLEDSSVAACRLISFVAFVSLQLSSWYLTLVSLDRCLCIHFLHWHRQIGRANRSVYIILSVTLLIALLNSHLLFFNGYRQSTCLPYQKRTCIICYARRTDPFYIFPNWEKMHVIIYNLIPFSTMLVSNCFIIRRSLAGGSLPQRPSLVETQRKSVRNYRQRKQRQLTYLLLCVTFLFVLLTTPVMIYNVFLRNLMIKRKPLKYILQGTLLCMQFTSHAINFFVYCHGASNFRDELRAVLPKCVKPKEMTPPQNTV